MNAQTRQSALPIALLAAILLPASAIGQVPVDDDGSPVGSAFGATEPPAAGDAAIPLLSAAELAELVGPVALYPDDLLAIVLPASSYPLQLVQAQRFLDRLEREPGLRPDSDWDDSIVALTNYPDVVAFLNEDLDWTWRLGEAVVAQQADVVAAVEDFRDRAYAAGNLRSDGNQVVARNEGVIEIRPAAEDVIYVPYYEPEQVVVYQTRPVYHYHARPYPVYYYPYPTWHRFYGGFFWGVTTAYRIGWVSDRIRVFHHSYRGHPFYGRAYVDHWWYRRPSIHIHNTIYVHNDYRADVRYARGDHWRPSSNRRLHYSTQRITYNRHYPNAGASPVRRTATVRNTDRRTEITRRSTGSVGTIRRPDSARAKPGAMARDPRATPIEPRRTQSPPSSQRRTAPPAVDRRAPSVTTRQPGSRSAKRPTVRTPVARDPRATPIAPRKPSARPQTKQPSVTVRRPPANAQRKPSNAPRTARPARKKADAQATAKRSARSVSRPSAARSAPARTATSRDKRR